MEEKNTSKLKGAFAKNAPSTSGGFSKGDGEEAKTLGKVESASGLKGSMSEGGWETPAGSVPTSSGFDVDSAVEERTTTIKSSSGGLKGSLSNGYERAPASPMSTTPVAPTPTAPASPMSTTPVAPTPTAPASPMSATPVAPTYTAPASPMSTTPVASTPTAPVYEGGVPERVRPVKKSSAKLWGIIAGLGAGAAAIVVAAVFLFGSKKGYMEPIDDFMTQINKRNDDAVEVASTLLPDSFAKNYKSFVDHEVAENVIGESVEDVSEEVQEYYEKCDDDFDDWELSFEVKSESKCSEKELKAINKEMEQSAEGMESIISALEEIDSEGVSDIAEQADASEDEVEEFLDLSISMLEMYAEMRADEAYEIKGKFVIDSDGDTYETDTVKLYVVEIDGEWTLFNVEGSLKFEDDDKNYFKFIEKFLSGTYFLSMMY